MKTLIKECYKCGESDYTSNLYIYDNRYYCNICADEIEAKIIDDCIKRPKPINVNM